MRPALLLLCLTACQEYDLKPTEPPIDEPLDTAPPPREPDIELSRTTVDFGTHAPACPSEPEVVLIRNVGDADLNVSSIGLITGSGAYNQLGSAPVTLAPNDFYEVSLQFVPPGADRYEDLLRIESDDPDESVLDVAMTGLGASEAQVVQPFVQVPSNEVDVLFVIDNSGSMAEEVGNLRQAFGVFIQQFVALGLDYHIGVVTTDMDNPAQQGRLQGPVVTPQTADPVGQFRLNADLGSSGSSEERGFDAAYAALSAPLVANENAGFLRPSSNLSVIVVTDEDDGSNMSASSFSSFLNGLQATPALSSFSAVGGPANGGLIPVPCISFASGVSAAPVPRYYKAVQNTGGIHASICQLDFTTILGQLAIQAAGLRTDIVLDEQPSSPSQITVTVNGQPLQYSTTNGWSYDPATNTVSFNGQGIPDASDQVDISYPAAFTCEP